MTASISPAADSLWGRNVASGRAPFGDFVGTTSGTINTAALVNHNLRNWRNEPTIPTRVMVTPNGVPAAGGILYEVVAGHTALQVDIRAAAISVAYRGRAWL